MRTDFQEETTLREMIEELEKQGCTEITRIMQGNDKEDTAGLVIVEFNTEVVAN